MYISDTLTQINDALICTYPHIHKHNTMSGPFITSQVIMTNTMSECIILLNQVSMATLGGCLPDANSWRKSTSWTILLSQVNMAKHLESLRLHLGHSPQSNQHDYSGECLPDASNFNTPSQLGRHSTSRQDS
jgi:hypothetical protein